MTVVEVIADQLNDSALADMLTRRVIAEIEQAHREGQMNPASKPPVNRVIANAFRDIGRSDDPVETMIDVLNTYTPSSHAYGFHPDESGTVIYAPSEWWANEF